MAAAAAVMAGGSMRRGATIRARTIREATKERAPDPVTMHLKEFLTGADDEDPVRMVEAQSLKDSLQEGNRMCKLTSSGKWLPTRLLATKERLFMLLKRIGEESTYEIVDSIPMHEILSVDTISDDRFGSLLDSSKHFAMIDSKSAGKGDESSPPSPTSSDSQSFKNNSDVTVATVPSKEHVDIRALDELRSSIFEIRTEAQGFNQGKAYLFHAGDNERRDSWMFELQRVSKQAAAIFRRNHSIEYAQRIGREIYDSGPFRIFMFLAISANFVISMIQAEIGDGVNFCAKNITDNQASASTQNTAQLYNNLDIAFTILFVAELLFNFAAHAFWPFWEDKWNWFDTVIVLTSVAFLFASASSGNGLVKQLRVLRVFRVVRAFRRIRQMREMVNAILASVLSAVEALLIGLLVVAIYANIGREFFAAQAPTTFCDFFHAFYTLFGIVAYHHFTDEVKVFDDNGYVVVGAAVYVYSYVAFVVLLFLQIVVAVLLDSFYKAMQRRKEEEARQVALKQRMLAAADFPMDRLLEDVVTFDTEETLTGKIDKIFDAFDAVEMAVNNSGGISFAEMAEGLYKAKAARLQIEDFQRLTDGGRLCDEDHEVDRAGFRTMMLKELRDFVQRTIAEAQLEEFLPADVHALLNSMKILLMELDHARADVEGMHRAMAEVGAEIQEEVRQTEAIVEAQRVRLQEIYAKLTGV